VADFNGDRKRDLIWRHVVTGSAPDVHWRIVGADDFNDDGKPDLV
jgi:hypothetical protein